MKKAGVVVGIVLLQMFLLFSNAMASGSEYEYYGTRWIPEEELPVVTAGIYPQPDDIKEGYNAVHLTLKGLNTAAMEELEYLKLSLPEEVAIVAVDWGEYAPPTFSVDKNVLQLTTIQTDEISQWHFVLYLSAEVNFSGNIIAGISSGTYEDTLELPIAQAQYPVSVFTKGTDIKLGRYLEMYDIVIIEAEAGAICSTEEGTAEIILTLEEWFYFDKLGAVTVTEGDIQLGEVRCRSRYISIEVLKESTVPSTVVISGILYNIDRTPPEGEYPLYIGGNALVHNFSEQDSGLSGYFPSAYFIVPDVFRVIWVAPGRVPYEDTYICFKVGDTVVQVNDMLYQMDVVPYIAEEEIMLPLRYFMNAFGITDDNVYFDKTTKLAVVVTNNRTVQFLPQGKDALVNGTKIILNTPLQKRDGRLFIALEEGVRCFGLPPPLWDESTGTIIFNESAMPLEEAIVVESLFVDPEIERLRFIGNE